MATRIHPIVVGTGRRRADSLVSGASAEIVDTVFTMFYIENDSRRILVDAGIVDPSEALPHHHPCFQSADQKPAAALTAIGIDPLEIDTVVLTHLHWDHCADAGLFTNATVYAQRREMQYASAPLPVHEWAYDTIQRDDGELTLPAFLRSPVTLIDGDLELTPEVTILATPGHSPGSQSVLVRGERNILLAGDNVPWYDNVPAGDIRAFVPNPVHVDLEDYFSSMTRCFQVADLMLPSHDPRVADQSFYH